MSVITPERKPLIGSIEIREHATTVAFRAVWRVDGKKESKTFDDYEDACDFLDEMAIQHRRTGKMKSLAKSRQPFSFVIDDWLKHEAKDVKKKTSIVKCWLKPEFGERAVGDVTRKMVQRWINEISRQPECDRCEDLQEELERPTARCKQHRDWKIASPSTVVSIYSVLSKFMREIALDDYLPNGSPVGKGLITLPTIERRMVILEDEELDHLLEVTKEQFPGQYVFVHLMAHTGMRIGEGLALGRRAFDGDSLLVSKSVKKSGAIGTTKTNRERRVELFPCCIKLLKKHLKTHENNLIFPGAHGGTQTPDNWRKRFWYPIREAAGLDELALHFHDLRHTHCSDLLAAGWEVTVVAERLGHSSSKMTLDVYGHAKKGRQARLIREKGLRAS